MKTASVNRFSIRGAPIPVERFEPTTAECFICGSRKKLSISERVFRCKRCGYEADRDLNATWVMLRKGLGLPKSSSLDWREVKPVERKASARILGSNPYILVSSIDEAGSPAS